MAGDRVLKILFTGDATKAEKAFKDAGTAADGLGAKTKSLGGHFGDVAKIAGGFALGSGLLKAPEIVMGLADRARDLELQMKKATTVFGDSLPIVTGWAATSAGAMGLTKAEATNLATGLGDLLVPMGFTRDAAAEMSTKTLGLAGALAEWSGGQVDAAGVADVLTKAYLGETDGLKALGIAISADDVTARLAAKGQDKLTGAALSQAKALAIQELVFEKSTDAQKAYADGAGSAARKQAELHAKIGELKDKLSTALMPAFTAAAGALTSIAIPALEKVSEVAGDVIPAALELGREAFSKLEEPIGVVVEWLTGKLVPALVEIATQDLAPKLAAVRDVFVEIAPRILEVAAAIAEKLQPIFVALGEFLAGHKEILAALAIVIAGVVVAAFVSWAVAAGAAALATLAAAAPVIALGLVLTALVAGIILLVKNWDDLEQKYPPLQKATEAVKETFSVFATWITGTLVPAIVKIGTTISETVGAAIKFVTDHWGEIEAFIAPAVKAVEVIVETAFKQIETTIRTVIGIINGIIDIFVGVFTGDWDRAKEGVLKIVDALKTGIVESITNAIDLVKGLAPLMLDAALALGGALKDGFVGALEGALGLAGDIANGVIGLFENALNYVVDRINDAIPNSISVPHLPDIPLPANPVGHVSIPRLARGGIVVAGDNPSGIEAIVPLERASEFGFGAGAGVVIHINGPVYARDEAEARRSAGDIGHGLLARMRARGARA